MKSTLLVAVIECFLFYILKNKMEKQDGSFISDGEGYNKEEFLFTYNEEEKQQNEINKNNAGLIFRPKFIPMYPELLQNGFTITESCLFGFIDFYLSNNDRFYFTNSQLAELLNVGETVISLGIKKLNRLGFIDVGYKIKAGGGKIRFLKNKNTTFKIQKSDFYNLKENNNKINNNKINNILLSNDNNSKAENLEEIPLLSIDVEEEKEKSSAKKEKEEIRKNIDNLITQIKIKCNNLGVMYDKTKEREFSKHILTAKEFGENCEKCGMDRVDFAINIIQASKIINYYKGICNGPMSIYKHYTDVYNRYMQWKSKQNKLVGFLPGINI